MSPMRVTVSRTLGRMRSLYSSALAIAAFLSASAVAFSFGLEAARAVRFP